MHSHVTQPISNAARLICSGRRCERYTPFESGLPARTGRVYTHEIPGGQLSNLNQRAIAIGVGDRFEQIEANYAAAERILGGLVKVTSPKVVGVLSSPPTRHRPNPSSS